MIDDAGLKDEVKKLKTMPLHLGVFALSNSIRIMKNFSRVNDGFYSNDLEYAETDSVYVEKKHWDNVGKAGLVGKDLPQDKKDYKSEEYSVLCF